MSSKMLPSHTGAPAEADLCADFVTSVDLPKLGQLIESSLKTWLAHLNSLCNPTVPALDVPEDSTRILHLVSRLPARLKALHQAYDPETIPDSYDRATAFLESATDSNESDWLKLKRFRQGIEKLEKEVRDLEQKRLSDLKQLMIIYEELMILDDHGEMDAALLWLAIDVMETHGIEPYGSMADLQPWVDKYIDRGGRSSY